MRRGMLRALTVVGGALVIPAVATLALLAITVRGGPAVLYPNQVAEAMTAQGLADEAAAAARFRIPGVTRDYPPTGQWHLRAMHVQEAWDLLDRRGRRGPVLVGVYDGMLDTDHPDLPWAEGLGVRADSLKYALHWLRWETHGAGVASAIAGRDQLAGTAVAPAASLVPFERYSARPDGSVDAALGVFASQGVRVGNFSLAVADPEGSQRAVDAAYQAGTLAVAGMFNEDIDQPAYPGALDRVLTVAGSDPEDRPVGLGYGPQLDLLAPASEGVLASPQLRVGPMVLGQRFGSLGGNSIAVALTSGVTALVLQDDPTLTSAQVEKRLKLSARKPVGMAGVVWHPRYGYGVVDAYAALTYDTTGPAIAVVSAERVGDGVVVRGGVIDEADDGGLLAGRERDRHLVGVPVSNVARVEVRGEGGAWQEATLNAPGEPPEGYARRFDAQVSGGGPVWVRAWDSAGNVGAEVWVVAR